MQGWIELWAKSPSHDSARSATTNSREQSAVNDECFFTIAIAEVGEEFYKDVVRAGYRGRYILTLARSVAEGAVDLEAFDTPPEELPDDELEARLLALPGIGPYAAAHIMMLLGRYSRLVLDSWTRPTYARLAKRPTVTDPQIENRFAGYGLYKGLAFWLYLTRDWIHEPENPEPWGEADFAGWPP